jgi:hypothetical protein
MTTSTDFTFSKGYLGLLSVLGCLLSIICCCLPSIVYVLRRLKEVYMRVYDYRGSATGVPSYVGPLSGILTPSPSSGHVPMAAEDCLEHSAVPPVLFRYSKF